LSEREKVLLGKSQEEEGESIRGFLTDARQSLEKQRDFEK
jgi:hypothetical protein